ncbi:MAG: 4Fe-4S binding protein [Candidatus Altiarchaeota archaeon]
MPDVQDQDCGGVEVTLKIRYVRWSIQFGSFYIIVPMLLPVVYCPYRLPWVVCDVCSVYWCPAKYMRVGVAYFMAGLTVVSGRAFCGWVCPYGSLQDLFNKIGRKASGSGDVQVKDASYVKYIFLAATILAYSHVKGWVNVPLLDALTPTVQSWMPVTLASFLLASVYSKRFWCRLICPLGAAMSFTSKIAPLTLRLDPKKCVECSACKKECVVVDDEKKVDTSSSDCTVCGECMQACPKNAIKPGLL